MAAMAGSSDLLAAQHSTQWLVKTWETEDGLPENSATAMVQTEEGYLWFGTFNGLVRFDGVQFKVFNPANTPALPGDAIVNLHLDRRRRLWISTLSGLARTEGGSWMSFGPGDAAPKAAVRSFSERANGDLLLDLFDGTIVEYSNGKFLPLPLPRGATDTGYLGLVDSQDHWWAVQKGFVGWWDGTAWHPATLKAPLPPVETHHVGCSQGHDGTHWILWQNLLLQFRGTEEIARRTIPETPGGIWSMTEDHRGHLWICTFDRGVYQVPPEGPPVRWTAPDSIAYNGTRFAFEDREQNLWIGTSGGGLTRLKRRRAQAFGQDVGLAERVVKSVCPRPGGGLWIATYGQGLFLLDGSEARRITWPGQPEGAFYIQSVLSDHDGRTWVGTYNQGLWVSEGDTFRRESGASGAGGNIIALFEDSRKRLWLSGGQGIARHEDGHFRVFGPGDGLPTGGVRCFAEDSTGSLWASNLDGVFRLEGERFSEVRDPKGAPLRQVVCLKGDPDGTVWMGTLDEGLLRWTPKGLSRVGPNEGLPVESVQGFLEDSEGFLWLASNRGVVRVLRSDLETRALGASKELPCQVLDQSDGLPSVECARGQQPVCARDSEGILWFGTLRGVARVDPAAFRINPVQPRTLIEELVYELEPPPGSGNPTSGTVTSRRLPGPFSGEIRLPSNSRRIEIHFTSPSFTAPEKVRFQVTADEPRWDWRDMGTRRVAYFEGLKPGTHHFRVRGSNNDGIWDESGSRLTVFLPPRFWQTLWFQGLVGSALVLQVALIGGLVLVHRRHRRAESEVQRQRTELAHFSRVVTVGELTTSLAHELNHPHSAILSNAQAGELFLSSNPPALDEVRKIFSDIVRDNRRASEIIQRLRAFLKKREMAFEPVDVSALLRDIALLVASDARARQVSLDAIPSAPLPWVRADRVHLQQVLLNLVLNSLDALTQGPSTGRRIELRAHHADPGTVEVSVRDTGPGIPPEKLARIFEPFFTTKSQGMGMGLSIARTLVEAHGGRIWASPHPDGGTIVRFTLPVAEDPHD